MINVNEVKEFVEYIANKDQSGNAISPKEFNLMLRRANDDLFRSRYGLPEQYRPGRPFPRVAYEQTQKITDDLRALKEVVKIPVDAQGTAPLPTDYVHKSNITFYKILNNMEAGKPDIFPRQVEVVKDDKLMNRLSSAIKKPTLDYPIANFKKDSITIYPNEINEIELAYLRYPATPNWAYTIDDNGVALYDSANSTDIEWSPILTNDICRLILSYIGINLREADLLQYAEAIKTKGA